MKIFSVAALCLVAVHSSGALPSLWNAASSDQSAKAEEVVTEEWNEPREEHSMYRPDPKPYREPEYPATTTAKPYTQYPTTTTAKPYTQEPEYPTKPYTQEPEYPAEPEYDYPTPAPYYDEDPEYYEPNLPVNYNKDYCKTIYETEYYEKCVNYYDKVCYTNYHEHCRDVERKKCQGIVTTDQVRKCVNVTELLCGLVETVQYEMVHTGFSVQKCQTIKERVCDTVYEPQTKTKDDYQCITIPTYKCYHKEKTVYDKVCRHETKYDCETYANDYKKPYGGDDYGKPYGGDSYSYDCKNKTKVNCYDTPRVVKNLVCNDGEEKVCEKFPEQVPNAVEKQNCHDEDKKVCEMEQRKQPKQIKKYVYKKQCRKVPRQICSSADVKYLVPQCAPTSYKYCDYTPDYKCETLPKKYCFKVPRKIKKYHCDTYGDNYSSPKY